MQIFLKIYFLVFLKFCKKPITLFLTRVFYNKKKLKNNINNAFFSGKKIRIRIQIFLKIKNEKFEKSYNTFFPWTFLVQ